MGGISLWHFRFPIYLAFLYPLSMLLGAAIAMYSMIVTLTGRAVWKGRRIENSTQKPTATPLALIVISFSPPIPPIAETLPYKVHKKPCGCAVSQRRRTSFSTAL